jgi:uncharacterized protein involved in exopolysaccharide biosynthesis
MREPIEALRYIRYVWERRVWILLSAATAVALALGISMWMTPEYTATVRVVVEPPAGTDLRSAMAVSPIYMESLRTYEQFASSDTLFASAIERFGLRALHPGLQVESLKKRVLRVEILRNTRILEIEATLPAPRKAQALAQFLADSTVALNGTVAREGERDLLAGLESQERDARAAVDRIDSEWARVISQEPVDSVKAALDQDETLRLDLEHQRLEAEQDAANSVPANASLAFGRRTRLTEILRQLDELDRQTAAREQLLIARETRRDQLQTDRRTAQTALAAIETRLREARSEAGYRGDRLRVIDPGIVPERPSSPNLPLNVAAALLLGLLLPLGYFTLQMQFRESGVAPARTLRPVARAVHE